MIYVSVLVFALIFFFGVSRSAELAAFLEHREQRRNLVLRMLGFLAMSSWIHAIPSILLSVYMRETRSWRPNYSPVTCPAQHWSVFLSSQP